jgi:hypothetical protein
MTYFLRKAKPENKLEKYVKKECNLQTEKKHIQRMSYLKSHNRSTQWGIMMLPGHLTTCNADIMTRCNNNNNVGQRGNDNTVMTCDKNVGGQQIAHSTTMHEW